MPVIESKHQDVMSSEGVHLYHFWSSTCSQRVRLVLEEKKIEWIGHHIDLTKHENASAEYQLIHPKGYVPAIVHDGQLITESMDIISYLERSFGGSTLIPTAVYDKECMHSWLVRVQENQQCLKYLTYEFLYRPKGYFLDEKEVSHYAQNQKNSSLVDFVHSYVAGFPVELITHYKNEAIGFLASLDHRLGMSKYVCGSSFSLADIVTVVSVHRYLKCGIADDTLTSVKRWYSEIVNRKSFQTAITEWEKAGLERKPFSK